MLSHFKVTKTFFLTIATWCVLTLVAPAQWLVYELRFTPEEDNVNFQSYTGAYVITPLHGGISTMVLLTESDGLLYAPAPDSARFFMAANRQVRKSVISSLAANGTSHAVYTASGYINKTIEMRGKSGTQFFRVAGEMSGRLMVSDDESEMLSPGDDGSLGLVGSAIIKGTLREDLTRNASTLATMPEAMNYIVGLLERVGYKLDADSDPLQETELDPSELDPSQPVDPAWFSPNPVIEDSNPLFPAGSANEAARRMDQETGVQPTK